MTDEPQVVTLEIAHSPFEAQVIVGVLQEANIPAYISGQVLADEFAISQALMNLAQVEIQVPRSKLGEARAVLAAARRAGEDLDEDFAS